MDAQDRQFLQALLNAGQADMLAGRMVVAKTSDRAVRNFASQVIMDHEDMDEAIRAMARNSGTPLEAVTTTARSNELQALGELSGNVFDQEYIKYLIRDQDSMLQQTRQKEQQTNDQDIRQMAAKVVGLLAGHISRAKQIQEQIQVKSQIKTPSTFNEPFIVHPSESYTQKRSDEKD